MLYGKVQLGERTAAEWEIKRRHAGDAAHDDILIYDCTYTLFLVFPVRTMEFELEHRYGDGATKLIANMLLHVSEAEESGGLVARAHTPVDSAG